MTFERRPQWWATFDAARGRFWRAVADSRLNRRLQFVHLNTDYSKVACSAPHHAQTLTPCSTNCGRAKLMLRHPSPNVTGPFPKFDENSTENHFGHFGRFGSL